MDEIIPEDEAIQNIMDLGKHLLYLQRVIRSSEMQ